jgi:hypothetical protein
VTGADRSGAVTRARGVLDRIPHRCATSFVAAGNGVLPAVGGACGGLVGPAGSAVAGTAVRECLLNALDLALASLDLRQPSATTTVIIVRHAERNTGEDPPLNPEGEARAQALASALSIAGVTGIFTTPYLRNQQTAVPLAAATAAP